MNFGERVRALRKAIDWSQAAAAEWGAIKREVWAQIESGKKENSHAMRRSLAASFDLSIEDLDAYIDGRIDVAEAMRRRGWRTRAAAGESDRYPGRPPMLHWARMIGMPEDVIARVSKEAHKAKSPPAEPHWRKRLCDVRDEMYPPSDPVTSEDAEATRPRLPRRR